MRGGLFSEELNYYRREFCASKWVGIDIVNSSTQLTLTAHELISGKVYYWKDICGAGELFSGGGGAYFLGAGAYSLIGILRYAITIIHSTPRFMIIAINSGGEIHWLSHRTFDLKDGGSGFASDCIMWFS